MAMVFKVLSKRGNQSNNNNNELTEIFKAYKIEMKDRYIYL